MTPHAAARRAMALTLGFDIIMSGIAMLMASALVWWSEGAGAPFPIRSTTVCTLFFMVCVATAFVLTGVQKQVWRHMGWSDAVKILQAISLAGLLYLPLMLTLNGVLHFPVTTLLAALMLCTIAIFAGRMYALSRTTQSPMQIFTPRDRNGRPVLLVGDTESCAEVIRSLEYGPQYKKINLLGLVETQSAQPGRAIRGIPVMGGLDELAAIVEILGVRYKQKPWVAVTGSARDREIMMQVLDVTSSLGLKIMALSRDKAAQVLEPVRPADLLARPERELDRTPIANLVQGASVLVTGGGGTIGSELARQVAAERPEKLTIMDASEYNLYSIDLDLQPLLPKEARSSRIGDIRDVQRVRDVFARANPDIVIHAAALKHVPLMERNVCEAVLTNVGGAVNCALAAAGAGVKRFVFISTDKAVDPDNVMGATKRLAEVAISRIASESGMAASMVRFGNVLGSSGSVVPLFERQIASGGPITLTDEGVTRYFMTVEEASSLVLQAAALQTECGHSDLFVLDMGEPIQILQLAETLIRLKGLVPGSDIEIVTTGLRDGEKMHEALTYEHEAVEQTDVGGVMRVAQQHLPSELFDKRLAELIEAATARDREQTLRLLGILVPEYGADRAKKAQRLSA